MSKFPSLIRKASNLMLIVLLVFAAGSSTADDTEIYFSGGTVSSGNTEIIPNVLFILDTSGSMDNDLSGDEECGPPTNDCRSRIEVLRETMADIIADLDNVNIGLMRFTQDNGGPVLFPITYIDEDLANVVGETDANSFNANATEDGEEKLTHDDAAEIGKVYLTETSHTISQIATAGAGAVTETITVQSNDDDAEESPSTTCYKSGTCVTNNDVFISGLQLDVSSGNLNGVRFTFDPGTVPKCTDLTSATLTLTRRSGAGTTDFDVWGQDTDTTNSFQETDSDISSRADTTATVNYTVDSTVNPGSGLGNAEINVEAIVEEIIQRNCSAVGANDGSWDESSLALFFNKDSGVDYGFSSEDDAGTAPSLTLQFNGAAVEGQTKLHAFRFDELNIPQGATVSNASMCFMPAASGNTATTWTFGFEQVIDSAALSTTSGTNGLLNRAGGTTVAPITSTTALWTVPNWTQGTQICTDDADFGGNKLSDVLEAVAAQTGWCGGNAATLFVTANNTNTRIAESLETDPASIEITYEYNKSAANGCIAASDSAQANNSDDDAQQNGAGSFTDTNESNLPIGEQLTGYRFDAIDIPNGANITGATLTFRSNATVSGGNAIVNIKGELPSDGDADAFAYQINHISGRNTTGSQSWTLPTSLADEQSFTSDDFTSIVQSIVSDSNWASGQAMVFILEPTTTDTDYAVHSRDSNASKAAKLNITYETSGDTDVKSVRDKLIEIVLDLPSGDHTPIPETMLEAARYWRGETMYYGFSRDGQSDTRLSHPGSYCNGPDDCNGAITSSAAYTPASDQWGVQDPGDDCDESNLDTSACSDRNIKGTTSISYISPFNTDSTCQSNYQILLTDGGVYDRSDSNPDDRILNAYGETFADSETNITKVDDCYGDNSTFKPSTDITLNYDTGGDDVQECTVDLMEFLAEVDQSSTLDNDQLVVTSTIGFDLGDANATQFIKDMANLGGGDFYEATSADDLTTIFETFLAQVRNVPTSFVAPSLATNAFNRLLSRDEIYFGLFTPENDIRWPGNAKKFNICVDSDDGCTPGEILDASGAVAIDDTDDRFFDDSRSHWSSIDDGGLTTVGGTGAEITEHHQTSGIGTKIYTEVGGSDIASPVTLSSGSSFNASGYVYKETNLTSDNWDATNLAVMRKEVCTTPSTTDGSDCEDRMKWLLGKKITTGDDDISVDQRWSVTDVLHSSPVIITYGGSDSDSDGVIDTFFDKLIYGTNDGAFHMVNPTDTSGREDWRFIPYDLLGQQQDLFDNAEATHIYGLDSTPVTRVVDHNGNGIIERPDSDGNNDTVHAYIAMRRGGDQIYALDLSGEMSSTGTEITPKFLWKIDGGTTSGYGRLGQTWSRPVLADISFDDDADTSTPAITKTVLIFGGGNDTDVDDSTRFGTNGGADNQGNAIYIADADTGAKILSISHPGCTASCSPGETAQAAEIDIKVAEMQFAIPSAVTVLDSDGDGLDDRIYVGDTGGQVWRVDLGADIASNSPGNTIVGRLASISDDTDTTGTDYRRFYEPPSVVQVTDTTFADGIGSEYDYVLMGSGYRAHPLFEDTEERFYAFRDTWINGMTKQSTNNEAADYPVAGSTAGGDGVPISHSVTDQLIDVSTQTLQDAADNSIAVGDSLGWFLDFDDMNTVSGVVETPGEKVLSAAVTISGTVFFTTYVPGEDADGNACEGVEIGSGRAYNLDILSTKAAIDWDSTSSDTAGRRTSLGGGIPSDVVPIFTEEGVIGIVGVEGGATQLGELSGLPRFKTYWYDES
jgi:type IV pilus assembly protein PilY1